MEGVSVKTNQRQASEGSAHSMHTAETKKIKIAPTNANIVKITVQQVGDGCVWGGASIGGASISGASIGVASINTWWCKYWRWGEY